LQTNDGRKTPPAAGRQRLVGLKDNLLSFERSQMKRLLFCAVLLCVIASLSPAFASRVWTDSTGQYMLDADLIAVNDKFVVLQRADHELVMLTLDSLSDDDRNYLASSEVNKAAGEYINAPQTWTLTSGLQIKARIVDYAERDLTIQRRRGRIYVNDRVLDNLPDAYQQVVQQTVAHFAQLRQHDRRSIETWLVRQRGQPQTFRVPGVVVESESGDEYLLPFALLSDDDQRVLRPGFDQWQAATKLADFEQLQEQSFMLEALAAARHRDQLVQRNIAMLQLKLQAVEAGVTSLWEVTLYPAVGQPRPPQWVVVAGRDSRQATTRAIQQNPGYVVGPVRRVSRR
jgi:hypothetical protein